MAKSYVNFNVSQEVVAKTIEALQLAKQSGTVRKGANEVTKSVERGLASFVVIAEDVEPEEVVVHIPKLCSQKNIAYSYVPKKEDLGKAIGMNVPCTAVAIENQGGAANAIKDIVSKVTGVSRSEKKESAAPKEQKEQPKKEAKPKQQPQAAAKPQENKA
ncbi:MAG: 50S ribosomal protein L7Ae [Candidatus Marsarchaeota archaeon]|nr:50S ribosomal protein L7Ae [Candidatus Marsarchaeota archaeon]